LDVERVFQYTTPPLQPTPADLSDPLLLRVKACHFLASPEPMVTDAIDLALLRLASDIASEPLIVWEPTPLSCAPGSRDAHLKTAKFVDVYTPNHCEFLAAFSSGKDAKAPAEIGFDRKIVEDQALRVLEAGVGRDGKGAVVIRCGEHG
jgi:hypothetical protein